MPKMPPNSVDSALNAPIPEYDGNEETVEDVLAKRPKYGGRKAGTPNKNKKFELTKTAQLYSLRAFSTVIELMEDEDQPGPVRLAAAKEVLERGFGKSTQSVEISGADGGDIQHRLVVEFVGQLPTRTATGQPAQSIPAIEVQPGERLPADIPASTHVDSAFNPSKQVDRVVEEVVLPNFKKPWA